MGRGSHFVHKENRLKLIDEVVGLDAEKKIEAPSAQSLFTKTGQGGRGQLWPLKINFEHRFQLSAGRDLSF